MNVLSPIMLLTDPCRAPQDLVVPSFKSPRHYRASPLMGNAPVERDIFLFFKVCSSQCLDLVTCNWKIPSVWMPISPCNVHAFKRHQVPLMECEEIPGR